MWFVAAWSPMANRLGQTTQSVLLLLYEYN
jgi:hypothetical protein